MAKRGDAEVKNYSKSALNATVIFEKVRPVGFSNELTRYPSIILDESWPVIQPLTVF